MNFLKIQDKGLQPLACLSRQGAEAGVLIIYQVTNFQIRQFFFVGWAMPTLLFV